MGKKIKCNFCSKTHNSKALVLKCLRSQPAEDKDRKQKQRNEDTQTDVQTEQISSEIDNIYSQITEKRTQYYKFFDQYRRNGVSDKSEYKSMDEKQKIQDDRESLKFILSQLMEVQQFTKSKDQKRKKYQMSPAQKQQKLNRYLRENSDRIQSFEQLFCKNYFNDWQWQKKRDIVSQVDLSESQARSSIRQLRGKNKQSIKAKYVAAWKILTDPLTRVMLSDQFLEVWHDNTFPKFINPFKFRRLERQLKIERNYQLAKSKLLQDQNYRNLCQKFKQLSEQLIELKVCPIPPSLKQNAQKLVEIKQKKIETIEKQIEEIQQEAESSYLIILPPQPQSQSNYPTYWEIQREKRQKERLQRVRQKKAALEHQKWIRQMKKDKFNLSLNRYGWDLGFLMFNADQNGQNLKQMIEINHQNKNLKQICSRKDIDIEDLQELEFQQNHSIHVLKKIRKQMLKRLHPKPLKQTSEERETQRIRNIQIFKQTNEARRQKNAMKRTIY